MRNTRAISFTVLLSLVAASCGFAAASESGGITGQLAQADDDNRTLEEKVDTDGDGEMSDDEISAYAQTLFLEFSDCMRQNGYPDFTDVALEDLTEGAGSGQARFIAAMTARGVPLPEGIPTLQLCGGDLSDLQTFAPEPSDDEVAEQEAAVLEFAACMRSEGFSNWPDPDFAANGGNGYGPELLQEFDIQSDEVQSAIATCQAANSDAVDIETEPDETDEDENEADASEAAGADDNGDETVADAGDAAEPATTEVDRAPISPLIEGDTSNLNVAEVALRDLTQTKTFGATLGYGDARPFPTNTSGVITELPNEGDVIGFGDVLFRVDGQPVVLLEGDVPQYRPFDSRMTDGADVEQLERNLVTLGYGGDLTVDTEFTRETAEAIDAMQLELGANDTSSGRLRPFPTNTSGVVTELPNEGDVIGFGDVLFRVDGQPVVLLEGDIPQYRPFNSRMTDGPDVEQLERNLVALGYTDESKLTVDSDFTNRTVDAVEAMQLDLGGDDTGTLALGRVVFSANPIRVGAVNVELGQTISPQTTALSAAVDGLALGRVVFSPNPIRVGAVNVELGQTISPQVTPLHATESDQRVTLDLDAEDLSLLPVDTDVDIELPDGTVLPGVVSEVAAVATQSVTQQGVAGDPTTAVTVVFASGEPSDVFDAAPVDVVVTEEVSAGVLTVPVPALIALSGGGHAVELIVEGGTQLIGVDIGDFVDDFVEVRGDIQAGDRVVMAGN